MNEIVFVMLQTVARSMQGDPALAQKQLDMGHQPLSGTTAQSVPAASAPILDRLIS